MKTKRHWSYWELACADCHDLYALFKRVGEWTIYRCPLCEHEVLVRSVQATGDTKIHVNESRSREDNL